MSHSEPPQRDEIMHKQPNFWMRFVYLSFYIALCAWIGASVVAKSFVTELLVGIWFGFVAGLVLAAVWILSCALRRSESPRSSAQ
jgi:hypothetical protein